MKYLIWQSSSDIDQNKNKLLKVLLTNYSFAEIFEGNNPLYPVGETIKMHQKKYKITQFQKMEDMIEVKVDLVDERMSEAA